MYLSLRPPFPFGAGSSFSFSPDYAGLVVDNASTGSDFFGY